MSIFPSADWLNTGVTVTEAFDGPIEAGDGVTEHHFLGVGCWCQPEFNDGKLLHHTYAGGAIIPDGKGGVKQAK